MAIRRRHSAFCGTWIALLAIWVQALLPAVHHPATMALGEAVAGIDRSICLAPTVAAEGGHDVDPHNKGPAHKPPTCPLCQAAHAIGGFVPPSAAVVVSGVRYGFIPYIPTDTAAPRLVFRGNAQPRGPPAAI